jgi:hypothetical protein
MLLGFYAEPNRHILTIHYIFAGKVRCAAADKVAKDERYAARGVSASKEDVHNAIKNVDKGLFPQAFCKIIPDFLGNDPAYCNIMHAGPET